ncbi:hypothetical protein LQ327_23075 [Actinomycetospora endophytica]|uniref:Uncharacterized protein n=1 Tax=Actinomycetospora endophytica TaxID=2291215 RepID=A0ABS8PDB4_9PSEU|nr:hypothetical protein [Actinomycetospora endophytica]MCD2196262.1 hypothetical protein [Actinomycetospora endophytica]
MPAPWEPFNPTVCQAEGVLSARFEVPIHLAPMLLARHAQHAGLSVAAMAEQIVSEVNGRADPETAAARPDGPRSTSCASPRRLAARRWR